MGRWTLSLCAAVAAVAATASAAEAGAVELSQASFDEVVFESGKNTFIKFFAPWCGHCKRMKPAWDDLADKYKDSDSVVIADVDCPANTALCSKYSVSGYPTVKYFKDGAKEPTDYKGGRDLATLEKFVKDNLEVSCTVSSLETCTDKEKGYHDKWVARGADEVAAELERLKGMTGKAMKPDLKKWLMARLSILKQLAQQ
ncbi:Protein disulfide-isomerase-like protein EhSep2 [Durusdinium trenchii]|uniref:Protein disulfide-isomerase-like protein EhSep2 n=1 Tax=Durusdinium trenchii TaxID=1381693 RepID=A0ABP0JSI2_9DINO